MFLKNCWYQAGWSEEVAPGKPLARTLLDQSLLFWRDGAGVRARRLLDALIARKTYQGSTDRGRERLEP